MVICRGVEISMAGGGEVMVCPYPLVSDLFFFFFFSIHIFIVRYKNSHVVLAMA